VVSQAVTLNDEIVVVKAIPSAAASHLRGCNTDLPSRLEDYRTFPLLMCDDRRTRFVPLLEMHLSNSKKRKAQPKKGEDGAGFSGGDAT
jgi:hypothetical protein